MPPGPLTSTSRHQLKCLAQGYNSQDGRSSNQQPFVYKTKPDLLCHGRLVMPLCSLTGFTQKLKLFQNHFRFEGVNFEILLQTLNMQGSKC